MIEDFDKAHAYQAYYLKIWADRYAFPVEIKCGADLIRPERIAVTSNYSIRECFPNPQDYGPLERRFKQIHKSTPWDATVDDLLVQDVILNNQLPKKVKSHKPVMKKRKYDQPAVAKKPWTSKKGKIVPNTEKQLVIEDLAKTQEITPTGLPAPDALADAFDAALDDIAKEKEIIELMDSDNDCDDMEILESLGLENCENCGSNIAICDCFEEEEDDVIDEDYREEDDYSYDDESDDLFDI